jgi:magnesium transporter
MEPEERAFTFRLLDRDRAWEVFETVDPSLQQIILSSLREPTVREYLEHMEPDDRIRLFDEMPAVLAKRLLEGLSFEERRLTSILLGYPEDSVGRIMSPEFVSLRASMRTSDAMDRVRRYGAGVETIYTLPVVDNDLHLVGMTHLHDLVLADPDNNIENIMDRDYYVVQAFEDREKAARLVREAGLIALPVTDSSNRLVGVLTVDDAMSVLEAEETEDMQRIGASGPLGRPYLSVSVFRLARIRVVWLFSLILAAMLTVNVLNYFQQTLESVVALALFVPFLINTGGNVGSQTATLVIRAMAVGDIRFGDFGRVVFREIRVGLLLGLILGVVASAVVSLFFGLEIALVILTSLATVCVLAAFIGSTLPLLARRIGMDPAVVSTPFITTMVDVAGLIIYFLLARAIVTA